MAVAAACVSTYEMRPAKVLGGIQLGLGGIEAVRCGRERDGATAGALYHLESWRFPHWKAIQSSQAHNELACHFRSGSFRQAASIAVRSYLSRL